MLAVAVVMQTIDGAEVVWQAPPLAAAAATAGSAIGGSGGSSSSSGSSSRVRGVVFIAHGCGHSAIDWWPQSESCPKCIGLPEEMNVTLHLLTRGYVAVAVSSADRTRSRCWQNPWAAGGGDWDYSLGPLPVDWMQVKRVLDTLLLHLGAAQAAPAPPPLPRYALGASSGGGFVMSLPLVFPPGYWSGLIVQIAAAPPGMLAAYKQVAAAAAAAQQPLKPAPITSSAAATSTAATARGPGPPSSPASHSAWPPTLFVHMPRDTWLGGAVAADVAELRGQGVPVHEVRVLPQPLTPLYLVQRCAPEIDEPTSRAIFEAFRASGYIDGRGYLRRNPRGLPSWRHLLLSGGGSSGGGGAGGAGGVPGAERLRLRPEASPLAEALNHLYAVHELSSEPTTACLDWLEARQ
ncbi:hypothetical protein HYH02_015098 [Chlamydomonas schloesseri]|uniref:Uncharacterized protein n=1 Tax=Chlamydomonas schloesseri TaxID=2026947 RepID=A0A835SDP0_9CHLO|nr:hypothetical protein HYH02_015098 [Chlamydomonas schloesseri]|eukprot:KAG2425049.1 hypothetical protein HYH02_015098 [Chlamydomonas schloesseri]